MEDLSGNIAINSSSEKENPTQSTPELTLEEPVTVSIVLAT